MDAPLRLKKSLILSAVERTLKADQDSEITE